MTNPDCIFCTHFDGDKCTTDDCKGFELEPTIEYVEDIK